MNYENDQRSQAMTWDILSCVAQDWKLLRVSKLHPVIFAYYLSRWDSTNRGPLLMLTIRTQMGCLWIHPTFCSGVQSVPWPSPLLLKSTHYISPNRSGTYQQLSDSSIYNIGLRFSLGRFLRLSFPRARAGGILYKQTDWHLLRYSLAWRCCRLGSAFFGRPR